VKREVKIWSRYGEKEVSERGVRGVKKRRKRREK
jgi:hypothetical protein